MKTNDEKTNEITTEEYIASDGTGFVSKDECLDYEQKLSGKSDNTDADESTDGSTNDSPESSDEIRTLINIFVIAGVILLGWIILVFIISYLRGNYETYA